MSTLGNRCCSVCGKAIPSGRLMCVSDWRLVPAPMQRDVWRTWKAFQDRTSAFSGLRALADYRVASDAATLYVKSLKPQTESAL